MHVVILIVEFRVTTGVEGRQDDVIIDVEPERPAILQDCPPSPANAACRYGASQGESSPTGKNIKTTA